MLFYGRNIYTFFSVIAGNDGSTSPAIMVPTKEPRTPGNNAGTTTEAVTPIVSIGNIPTTTSPMGPTKRPTTEQGQEPSTTEIVTPTKGS